MIAIAAIEIATLVMIVIAVIVAIVRDKHNGEK